MNKNYDIRVYNLIEKINKLNLRQKIPFKQDKIIECLKKIDVILGRDEIKKVQKIINFKEFSSSASSASSAFSASSAYSASPAYLSSSSFSAYLTSLASPAYSAYLSSSTYSTYSAYLDSLASPVSSTSLASLASSSFSASSAYLDSLAYLSSSSYLASSTSSFSLAYLASIDYNFREFIFSFEWNLKNKGNEKDKKFLKIQQLLLKCKEYGLGYAFRNKDILNLFQAPIVQIKNNRYHSTKKPAIYFDDNNQLYYIEGIKFKKSEWEDMVSGKLSIKEILMWTNTEKQRAAMSVISTERFITELNPKEINRNERGDILYEVEGILPKPVRIAKYKDWSTERVYAKFVRPELNTIDEVLAQKHNIGLVAWINGLHS